MCKYILDQEGSGASRSAVVKTLLLQAQLGELPSHLLESLQQAAVGKKSLPSRATLFEWCAKFSQGGVDAVLKKHQGGVRKEGGWESLALELYSQPSKPTMASVQRDLCRLWAYNCTYEQVSSYLSALPSHLSMLSSARIGKLLFRQQQKTFVVRHTKNLKAGSMYQADGYRADVYLAHPVTGDIWRPEIMHILDVKSRYLVGYRIMANEGSYDVMIGWAECFARWNHVPVLIYIDNGSGYKNKLTELPETSYYMRAGVQQVIHSIPHNPKGKGSIERYHRIVKDDFLKSWKPQFYCGDDMAAEVLVKTVNECKAGRLQPPSLQQFIEAYDAWLRDDYHQRPNPENKYITREQGWRELDPIPPHALVNELARPMRECKVRRASIQLLNRRYESPALYAWNMQSVLVEYDVLNHHQVTIRALSNQDWICDAPLVEAIGMVGDSFMADKEQQALLAATKRQEKKLKETQQRAGLVIDAEAVSSNALQAIEGSARQLNSAPADSYSLDDFFD